MQDVERDEDATCHHCRGTGIGYSGPPDTSKCPFCHGRGYHIAEPEDDSDRAYDEMRDRQLEDRDD